MGVARKDRAVDTKAIPCDHLNSYRNPVKVHVQCVYIYS